MAILANLVQFWLMLANSPRFADKYSINYGPAKDTLVASVASDEGRVMGRRIPSNSVKNVAGCDVTASRLIAEAVTAKKIRPVDPEAANKIMRYVPYWA